ncbi:MAG: VCBS repeat-containing protein [Bacteroidota bacterium]
MKKIKYCLILLPFFMLACSGKQVPANEQTEAQSQDAETASMFKLLDSKQSGVGFTNTITENASINMIDYFYLYNGGGVALGDVNNDSLPDLYFTGNQVSSKLYLNKGGMRFEEATKLAGLETEGWCSGVTMVDINQDGFMDLYVCRAGHAIPAQRANLLFVNNGKDVNGVPTFTEKAAAYGLAFEGYSTQAAFFDYDKDGDLDMYLLTSTNDIRAPNTIVPITKDGSGAANDRLYRNDGTPTNPHFTDVSKKAGILYDGLGLGLGINDLNGDGWEDIYVSNDFLGSDHLYINNQNGTFSERAGEYLKHQSNFAMGNDLADFNNDGLVDIMVVDMLPADNEQRKKMAGPMKYEKFDMGIKAGYQPQYMRNTLQINNGKNAQGKTTYSEIGQLAGVHSTEWSWAPLFGDFDNDGFKDLFITNGYRRDITDMDFVMYNSSLGSQRDQQKADETIKEKAKQMPGLKKSNYLFRNKGDLTFEDRTMAWGLSLPSYSNGAAYGDLDNDGDLDIVVNNIDDPAFVYENTTADSKQNHYLKIRLKGSSQNRNGLGADVRVYQDGRSQLYHQSVTRGYQSSLDYLMHVGLGTSSAVDSLEIIWPDGKAQQIKQIATNQTLLLDYQQSTAPKKTSKPIVLPLLVEVSKQLAIAYVHQEDDYNDFAREVLLPHKNSRQGPGLAVGDLNGDQRDDFFVSGSFGQSGKLFFQTPQGRFRSAALTSGTKFEEETGALCFDAENDGDLDLYVVSGGNEFGSQSEYYQDKLYLNDGSGHFSYAPHALPTLPVSGSCVVAADYDGDNDLDLFVGGRLTPLQFPLPGNSYVLRNDGGTFKDVTDTMAPGLRTAGMVTSALWTDFNLDHQVDLMVVGECMPIRFYQNTGGFLKEVTQTTGLSNTNGWWNSLNAADFDHDGDIDYVLGNLGLNSRYKASVAEPVSVYAGDFDGNGSWDPIMTYFLQGQEYPTHSRDDMTNQMVSLRRKFERYGEYAKAHLSDIISPENLTNAYVAKAFVFENSYLENLGQGKFRLHSLPLPAQMAPIFGTICQDFDNDTHPDLLLVGNSYATEVVAGQYDASIGMLLKGDGKGNFQPVAMPNSGFFVEGDTKGMANLTLTDGRSLALVAVNSGKLSAYTTRQTAIKSATKVIALGPMDAYAEVVIDGKKYRQEFYHGSSYLSQSSRQWTAPAGSTSVVIYSYAGKSRPITL